MPYQQQTLLGSPNFDEMITGTAPIPPSSGLCVWGIDPNGDCTAICAKHDEWHAILTIDQKNKTYRKLADSRRLAAMYHHILAETREFAKQHPPAAIYIERVIGHYFTNSLYEAVGIIRAAISEATGQPTLVVSPTEWKKATVGNAHASKDDIVAWVESHGITPNSQHEADAAAIASCAHDHIKAGRWAPHQDPKPKPRRVSRRAA